MHLLRRASVVIACLSAAALIAACGSSSSSSSSGSAATPSTGSSGSSAGKEKVSMVLEFAISPSQEGFFSALGRNYFAKQGLDVSYQVPGDISVPIKAVASGKANFALSLSTLSASAYGSGSPIKVISTVEPRMGLGMLVLPSKIKSFKEIEGKTVGNGFLPQEVICFKRELKKYGIAESSVKLVNPGYNLVASLLQGKVDMVDGSVNYESQIVKAITGKEGHVFQFNEENVCPPYSIQLVTSKSEIEQHPETVRKFVKAELEGVEFATRHPKEANDEFLKRFPDQDPKQTLPQAIATAPTYCASYSEKQGIGYSDPKYWEELIAMTASEPSVLKKTFPQSELVTNEYLPKPALTEACSGEFYKKQFAQPIP
jgi:ABC-type nitrate/sulfonate/bicarbonate transport system substrate-binding protein